MVLPGRRIRTHPLFILLPAAFVVRVIALFLWRHYGPTGDAIHYLLLAQWFAGHGGDPDLIAHFPPLYSFLISLLFRLHYPFFWAGRFISLLCSTLLLIPFYHLCRGVLGRRLTIFASSLLAFLPLLVTLSLQTWSEALYFFLLFSALWFAYRFAISPIPKYLVFSALLFAAAYYTRDEAFLPFLVSLLVLIAVQRRHLLRLCLFFLLFLLLIAPRLLVLYSFYDTILPSGKSPTNAARAAVFSRYYPDYLTDTVIYQQAVEEWLQTIRAVDDSGNLAIFSLARQHSPLKFLLTHPGLAARNFIGHWKYALFDSLTLSGWLLLLLSFTGALTLIVFKKRRVKRPVRRPVKRPVKRRLLGLLFLFLATTPLFAAAPFFQLQQYTVPPSRMLSVLLPLSCVLLALNLRYLLLLPGCRTLVRLIPVLTVLVSLSLMVWSFTLARECDRETARVHQYLHSVERYAAEFLPQLPATAYLCTPHEYFLLYLPYPSVIYPLDTPQKSDLYFLRQQVSHLILARGEWEVTQRFLPQELLTQYRIIGETHGFLLIRFSATPLP